MSKNELKVYRISEAIYVAYDVVARSEEEALRHYRDLPRDEWRNLVNEAAANNYCDEEIVDEQPYDEKEHDCIPHAEQEDSK